jgi:hypothetical protein
VKDKEAIARSFGLVLPKEPLPADKPKDKMDSKDTRSEGNTPLTKDALDALPDASKGKHTKKSIRSQVSSQSAIERTLATVKPSPKV